MSGASCTMKKIRGWCFTVVVSGPLWSRSRRAWSVVAFRGGSCSDFDVVGLRRGVVSMFFV